MTKRNSILILSSCCVVLAVLFGWLVFLNFKTIVAQISRRTLVATPVPMLTPPDAQPHFVQYLTKTPAGIQSTITIENKSSVSIDEVRITALEYNKQKVKGLPLVVKNIEAHTTHKIFKLVPTQKSTKYDTCQIMYDYNAGTLSGGGAVITGPGVSPPPAKRTLK